MNNILVNKFMDKEILAIIKLLIFYKKNLKYYLKNNRKQKSLYNIKTNPYNINNKMTKYNYNLNIQKFNKRNDKIKHINLLINCINIKQSMTIKQTK